MDPEAAHSGGVAVIGMACRLPGASTPGRLWELMRDGVDATGETPAERYDAGPYATRAGYLDGMADFDAGFFDMSPAEATALDPQQRLLLMTAWEALEDAGQPSADLAGSRAGVYVGAGRTDFLENTLRRGPGAVTAADLHNVRSLLAGRLSYVFDLRGPSMVIDTACSSSLVAVHEAVRSLRTGECPVALAAGVNLVLRPDEGVLMSQAGGLAADGRSRFGDAAADGHAPADAVAVVVLKPLAAAVADGDRVRAVIAGSAVGNDGRTTGSVLNPSLTGQIEVLRAAYADAGIDPADVDYVEAHGSGSPLLDPLELTAIGTVLGGPRRPADRRLPVGSVKTNVGHAEAAGGLAGLVKTVLCLEHGRIPATLNLTEPRTDVAWDELGVEIPATARDLPDRGRPAVAGVSAQGSSTLNAHVVLRQAVREPASEAAGGGPYPLVLSARTPEALRALARAYVAYLDGPGRAFTVRDIAYSAAVRRQHLEHRLVVTGSTHDDLRTALDRPGTQPGPIDWTFGPARYVPLPTYPWQTARHWPGDAPGDDLAAWVLDRHARTEFADDSPLAEVGIDSLAKLQLIVELQNSTGREIDPEVLGRLRTVGELRRWARELVEAA